jgi:hypothetical protein
MNVPTTGEPIQPAQPASSQAVTALVLGCISIACCHLLGPFAWYLGYQERKAIREGRSAAAGETLAIVGMVLGILATLVLAFLFLWILFFGGMAVLGGLMSAAGH